MTVADELNKLVELFRDGLLTKEEFQAAKAATLAAATTGPHADGDPSATRTQHNGPLGSHQAASASTTSTISALADCFAPSHNGENEIAFKHLATILTNVLQNPTMPKYQCLRLDNQILRSQLFHIRANDAILVPEVGSTDREVESAGAAASSSTAIGGSAAEAFLTSIGFQYEERPVIKADSDTGPTVERCLVLRVREPPTSPSTESFQRLSAALEAVTLMRQRDDAARQRFHEFESLRKSVAMEIRMEKMQQAVAMGEVDGYCEELFLSGRNEDDAEVAINECVQHVETLHRILTNIATSPNEQRFRELRLGNKRIYRTLVHQRGGLEFVLGVVGFTMSDAGIVTLQGNSEDVLPRVSHGLEILARLRERAEVERERCRIQQRNDAKEAAKAEVAAELSRERAKRRKEAPSLPDEGGSKPSGNRVPIEEALRQLLGR